MKRKEKNKKTDKTRWGKSLVVTGAMILLLMAASVAAINEINSIEEEKSIQRLYEETDHLANMIEKNAQSDRVALKVLAGIVAEYDDLHSKELWELLDSYSGVGLMSEIELLLPNDTVLRRNGKVIDAKGVLSFRDEAAKGEHISNRETDIEDPEKYITRQCMPIIKNGQTVAMLNGIIDLGNLPDDVSLDPYSGKGALYIIDGNTGDFLVDTWHPGEGGNIWELGERKMADGFDHEQLKEGVTEGDSAYVIFVSQTIGEHLYFYYEPMEINEWRIAVSVPESVVFESANQIKTALNRFLLFEILCLLVYFLWMMYRVRRSTELKQRQLEMLQDIYDVEKLLFNAHEKRENIWAALQKVGDIISAERAGIWTTGTGQGHISFFWERKNDVKRGGNEDYFYRLYQYFREGHREFEADDEESLEEMLPGYAAKGIHNIVAVPIEDMQGNICGILAGCNMRKPAQEGTPGVLLKNMVFSFGMFCHNLSGYNHIRKQRDRDILTGLYNRTRYERDIARMSREGAGPLACVYIDVNGLHEMNNTEGHYKGDEMLRTVAREMKKQFGKEKIYRIGGDEFVIFVPGAEKEEVLTASEELTRALQENDYHISVGVQYENDVSSLEELIKSAEKKMYEAKKKYYEDGANDRRNAPRG